MFFFEILQTPGTEYFELKVNSLKIKITFSEGKGHHFRGCIHSRKTVNLSSHNGCSTLTVAAVALSQTARLSWILEQFWSWVLKRKASTLHTQAFPTIHKQTLPGKKNQCNLCRVVILGQVSQWDTWIEVQTIMKKNVRTLPKQRIFFQKDTIEGSKMAMKFLVVAKSQPKKAPQEEVGFHESQDDKMWMTLEVLRHPWVFLDVMEFSPTEVGWLMAFWRLIVWVQNKP